jgi:aminoglycoside phosphotransferase (APT) family kinase protein
MHDDEVLIDRRIIARLLDEQFPELAHLPLERVNGMGTVNAIYRLGDELCVRLPRVVQWAEDLERELNWLPTLAPHVSLTIPEPVAVGQPSAHFPMRWTIYRWIDGSPYDDVLVRDEARAAEDLAAFIHELRKVATAGAPPAGRKPLAELDALTRTGIGESSDEIDHVAALAAWEQALESPLWDGEGAWIHADLLRPNLLVKSGRLHAVLDFGGTGVGDPAMDLIPAWAVFGPRGRAAFRAALDIDEGDWQRARGVALHQAIGIIPYYRDTNPRFVATALRTLQQVIEDVRSRT